jgi:hypothetical protein
MGVNFLCLIMAYLTLHPYGYFIKLDIQFMHEKLSMTLGVNF